MSTLVSTSNMTTNLPVNSEYIQTLIKENEHLKTLNQKLFKRTMNQKRKILRFKKIMNENNSNDSVKIVDESEPDNISEHVWEDVEDVMASYNISK